MFTAAALPSYHASTSDNTISGFSSGACMTSQMMMAFSDSFAGAGIFAGVPYNCSRGGGIAGL